MTTNMVKFGGGTGLMTQGDLASALSNMAMAAPRVGGDYQFLKLGKDGVWSYGQGDTVVEEGSKWAANPNSLEYGWISWDANIRVEGEVMVPITRPLPVKSSLRTSSPTGETTGQQGWQYQQSVVLACIEGEDVGTEVLYKQSSVGSQKMFKALTEAIWARVQQGIPATVPIVELKSEKYKHDKWGWLRNPIFEITGWATVDGEIVEEPEPEAKKAPAKAAAPEPEKDDEEAELEAEYAAAAAENPTPRRRMRRG